MELRQRDHVRAVMTLTGDGPLPADADVPDGIIRESWTRCVHTHGLDPTRLQQAVILPQHQLREHRDRIEDFLHIARHGMEALYQQVAGMGYCVLLTDARGVTSTSSATCSSTPRCAAPACTWAATGASTMPAPAAWAPPSPPARRSRCTRATTSMPRTSR